MRKILICTLALIPLSAYARTAENPAPAQNQESELNQLHDALEGLAKMYHRLPPEDLAPESGSEQTEAAATWDEILSPLPHTGGDYIMADEEERWRIVRYHLKLAALHTENDKLRNCAVTWLDDESTKDERLKKIEMAAEEDATERTAEIIASIVVKDCPGFGY